MLKTNGTGLAVGSYPGVCISATDAALGNSPYVQAFTLTGGTEVETTIGTAAVESATAGAQTNLLTSIVGTATDSNNISRTEVQISSKSAGTCQGGSPDAGSDDHRRAAEAQLEQHLGEELEDDLEQQLEDEVHRGAARRTTDGPW